MYWQQWRKMWRRFTFFSSSEIFLLSDDSDLISSRILSRSSLLEEMGEEERLPLAEELDTAEGGRSYPVAMSETIATPTTYGARHGNRKLIRRKISQKLGIKMEIKA